MTVNGAMNGAGLMPTGTTTTDARSCWILCRDSYNAPYFTWLKQGDPNNPKACICQMTYVNGGPYASVTGPVCPATGKKSVKVLIPLNNNLLITSMKYNRLISIEPL